jgi:hypothetical protein
MEFNDMAQVYPVDQGVIDRAAKWLLGKQQSDGAWQVDDYRGRAGQGEMGATGYVTWALIEAGYVDHKAVQKAIDYLKENAPKEQDPYSLALAANALTAFELAQNEKISASTQAILERLYEMRVEKEGMVYWQNQAASFMGASGQSGSIETTALTAAAFMQAGVYSEAINGALGYIVQGKDSWGTWGTTQATILALKALLLASDVSQASPEPATIRVSLNNEQRQEIHISPDNAGVVHLVTFDQGFSRSGTNEVQLEVEGGGNLMYQVATSYYLPWANVTAPVEAEELISIGLDYDRTALAVNDTVGVDVRIRLNEQGLVRMALVDLGLPPGFTVLTEDLDRLVEQAVIARYELSGRQIIIYLEDLSSDTPVNFRYRLRARFPMRAQTPPSTAYDYYNPGQQTVEAPLGVVVLE